MAYNTPKYQRFQASCEALTQQLISELPGLQGQVDQINTRLGEITNQLTERPERSIFNKLILEQRQLQAQLTKTQSRLQMAVKAQKYVS